MKDGDRFGKELAHLREEAMRASRIVRNLLTFVLAVEDDDPGVPPKLRRGIFNPFFTTTAS